MKRIVGRIGWCLLWAAGCTMCQSPYDYAGPVPGMSPYGTREGSAFSGGMDGAPYSPIAPGSPTLAQTPESAAAENGESQ